MFNQYSDKEFMTVAEVADVLRLSRQTIYMLLHRGILPGIKLEYYWRIPREAIIEVINEKTNMKQECLKWLI